MTGEIENRHGQQRRGMGFLLLLMGIFFLCVFGAWYWVSSGQPAQSEAFWFAARTNLAGVQFARTDLDPVSLAKLDASEVCNGRFFNDSRFESTIFLASWTGAEGKQVMAIDHTPDLCWAHVGWKPVELGHPKQIEIAFKEAVIPFECRIFTSPGGARREIVVWCSMLGGKAMPQSDLFRLTAEESNQRYNDHATRSVTVRRRLKITQFLETITHRLPNRGNRQFVRFSMPLSADWQNGLQQITNFGPQWLELTKTAFNDRSKPKK